MNAVARTAGVVRPRLIINNDVFGKDLDARLSRLVTDVEAAIAPAASAATALSRSVFKQKRTVRPFVPARPGRPTTQGAFEDSINWVPQRNGDGELMVDLDIKAMDDAYNGQRVWLIQEVGTGKSAYMGQPEGDYQRRLKVKSQIGRSIPFGLVWASKGGRYQSPGATNNGQLVPYGTATRKPSGALLAGVIQKEIIGKHYLRDGGRAGYEQFAQSALGAAKKAFTR